MNNDNIFTHLKIPSNIFAQNDNVVIQGENSGKKMFFLISGELDVIKKIGGIEEIIETILPGSFFGELGLVDRKPRTATIRVRSDFAKIAILDRDNFLLIAKNKPEFLLKLWKKITNWILEAEDRLELTERQLSDLRNLVLIQNINNIDNGSIKEQNQNNSIDNATAFPKDEPKEDVDNDSEKNISISEKNHLENSDEKEDPKDDKDEKNRKDTNGKASF